MTVPPYVRRHLAEHAAAGGVLDHVVTASSLPHLDWTVLSQLVGVGIGAGQDFDAALLEAWRSVRHVERPRDVVANAGALAVALATEGRRAPPPGPWVPRWSRWQSAGAVVATSGGYSVHIETAHGTLGGRAVVAVAHARQIQLWDVATGQRIAAAIVAPFEIGAVALGAGPPLWLVAVSRSGEVATWEPVTGTEIARFDLKDLLIRSCALAFMGKTQVLLAAGESGRLHVRDPRDGEPVVEPFDGGTVVRGVAASWTPSGLLIATGNESGGVRAWHSTEPRQALASFDVGEEVNGVAVDDGPDGPVLAYGTVGGALGVVALDLGTQTETRLPSEVRAVAVQGRLILAGCSDGTAWLATTGTPSRGVVLPHGAEVSAVALVGSGAEALALTTCFDGQVRAWSASRLARGPRIAPRTTKAIARTTAVASTPDGTGVVGGDEARTLTWYSAVDGSVRATASVDRDARAEHPGKGIRPPGMRVAVGESADGVVALTAYSNLVESWTLADDARSGARLVPGPEHELGFGEILLDLAVGADGAFCSVWAYPGGIRVVRLGGEAFWARVRRRPDWLYKRGRTPAATYLESGGRLCTAEGRTFVALPGHHGGLQLRGAGFGDYVSEAVDVPIESAPLIAAGRVNGSLALATFASGRLELWRMPDASPLLAPVDLPGGARSLAIGQLNGRDVVVTGHSTSVRIWNATTGRPLAELPFGTHIDAVDVRPSNGGLALTISGPGVMMVDLRDVDPREVV